MERDWAAHHGAQRTDPQLVCCWDMWGGQRRAFAAPVALCPPCPTSGAGQAPLTLGVSLSSVLSLLLPNSFIARLAVGGWFRTGTLQ